MVLSLRQARVCLDCDCLTDEVSCPQCDREGTVPIAGWFRPLDDEPSDTAREREAVTPSTRRWVLVVQHHQRDLYRVLRHALAGTGVEVLYERRVGQRRRTGPASVAGEGERRRTDRRRPRAKAIVYEGSAKGAEPERSPRPSGSRMTVRVARPRRRQSVPV
jgi:hypothetical protein